MLLRWFYLYATIMLSEFLEENSYVQEECDSVDFWHFSKVSFDIEQSFCYIYYECENLMEFLCVKYFLLGDS